MVLVIFSMQANRIALELKPHDAYYPNSPTVELFRGGDQLNDRNIERLAFISFSQS